MFRTRAAKTVFIIVCFSAAGWLLMRRSVRHRPSAPELDVVCQSCAWQGKAFIKGNWRKCEKCGKQTLHLGAVCPKCGKVYPFLDDELYLKDSYAALKRNASRVLPRCKDCNELCRPLWGTSGEIVKRE